MNKVTKGAKVILLCHPEAMLNDLAIETQILRLLRMTASRTI